MNNINNKYIQEFLEFFCDEEYEAGKCWAIKNQNKSNFKFFILIENLFEALNIVESSYAYNAAVKAFDDIYNEVNHHKCILNPEIIKNICNIEKYKILIDKNIYNGNVQRIIDFSKLLQIEIDNCKKIIYAQKAEVLSNKNKGKLSEKLNAYSLFSKSIYMIGESYKNRWEGNENKVYFNYKKLILNNINKLIKDENFILGYDLKSHLSSLDKFFESNSPKELNIENGTISFNYFSIVNFKYIETLKKIILNDSRSHNKQKIKFVMENDSKNWIRPVKSNLEDIWSGLKNSFDYTGKYTWSLNDITLTNYITNDSNKKKPIPIHVSLSYYNMGIFVLNFEICIKELFKVSGIKMSLTNYRYLLSLGTNFALSEDFNDLNFNKNYSFLNEGALSIFKQLEEALKNIDALSSQVSDILHINETDFTSFTLSNLYSFSESGFDTLEHMDNLRNSFAFKGLELENREVRTCIDNWILCQPTVYKNLAPVRYNKNELIKVDTKQCLIILPDQADWVRSQAIDSVIVTETIRQLLILNIKNSKKLFQERIDKKNSHLILKNIIVYRNKIEELLDLIEEGAITQFLDHEKFIKQIFITLNIADAKDNANKVLSKLQNNAQVIINEEKQKETRRNRIGLTIVTSFIGAGALRDLFDILNEESFFTNISLLFPISPIVQLSLIVLISAIIIYYGLKSKDD